MAVSEQSLAFCLSELRAGKSLKEVAASVKEKFEGHEQEVAIEWLRCQYKLTNPPAMANER